MCMSLTGSEFLWSQYHDTITFVSYLVQFFWKYSDKYKRAELEKGEPGKGRNLFRPNLKRAETHGNPEIILIAPYANIIGLWLTWPYLSLGDRVY